MLTIRETTFADLDDVRRLWADGEVMRFVGFPEGLMRTEAEMQTWLERIAAGRPQVDHYSIFEDGRYCGESFYRIDPAHRCAVLDIKLFPFARGRGIGTAGLSHAMEAAFRMGAEKVWVDPNPQNEKAIALYRRLGFVAKPYPDYLLTEGEAPQAIYMERENSEVPMRLLFEMDKKDYAQCTHSFVRNSARSVIIKDKKVAMIHSLKYDYYKFPGGGIEHGESPVEAMIRETREEAGLVVNPDTVREYGYVHRIQRSAADKTECFIQDNFYYLCEAADGLRPQELDGYEAEESYTLEYVEPDMAIKKNRRVARNPYDPMMFEREARVLERLLAEGYFGR